MFMSANTKSYDIRLVASFMNMLTDVFVGVGTRVLLRTVPLAIVVTIPLAVVTVPVRSGLYNRVSLKITKSMV